MSPRSSSLPRAVSTPTRPRDVCAVLQDLLVRNKCPEICIRYTCGHCEEADVSLPPVLQERDGRVRGRAALRMLKAQCKRSDKVSAQGEPEGELTQHFRIEARAGRCQACLSQQVPAEAAGERESLRCGGVAVDLTCSQLSAEEAAPVRIGVRQVLQWLAAPPAASGFPRVPLSSVWAFDDVAVVSGGGADRTGEAPGVGLFLLAAGAWVVGCAAYACCQVPDIPMVSPDLYYQQVLRRIENIPVPQDSPQFSQYKQYYMRQYQQHAQEYAALQLQYQQQSSLLARFDSQAFLHGLGAGLLVFAAVLAYCEYHHGTISCWMELAEEFWLAWRERQFRYSDPLSDPSKMERLLKEMGEEQQIPSGSSSSSSSSTAVCSSGISSPSPCSGSPSAPKVLPKAEKPKAETAATTPPSSSTAAFPVAASSSPSAAGKKKADKAKEATSVLPAPATSTPTSPRMPATQKPAPCTAAASASSGARHVPDAKASSPAADCAPAPSKGAALPSAPSACSEGNQGAPPVAAGDASAPSSPAASTPAVELPDPAAELSGLVAAAAHEPRPSSRSPVAGTEADEQRRPLFPAARSRSATAGKPGPQPGVASDTEPSAAAPTLEGASSAAVPAAWASSRQASASKEFVDLPTSAAPRLRVASGPQFSEAAVPAGGNNVRDRLRRKVVERQKQYMRDIVTQAASAPLPSIAAATPAPVVSQDPPEGGADADGYVTKRGAELLREAEELLCQLEQEDLLRQLQAEEEHRTSKRTSAARKKAKQRKASEAATASSAETAEISNSFVQAEAQVPANATEKQVVTAPSKKTSGNTLHRVHQDVIVAKKTQELVVEHSVDEDDEEPNVASDTTAASDNGREETREADTTTASEKAPTSDTSECASVNGHLHNCQSSEEEGVDDEAKEQAKLKQKAPPARTSSSSSASVSSAAVHVSTPSRRWADINAFGGEEDDEEDDDVDNEDTEHNSASLPHANKAKEAPVYYFPEVFTERPRSSSHRRKMRGALSEAARGKVASAVPMAATPKCDLEAAPESTKPCSRKAGMGHSGADGGTGHAAREATTAALTSVGFGKQPPHEMSVQQAQHLAGASAVLRQRQAKGCAPQGPHSSVRAQRRGTGTASSTEVVQAEPAAKQHRSWAAVVGKSPTYGTFDGCDGAVKEAVSMVLQELESQNVSHVEDWLRANSAQEWFEQRVASKPLKWQQSKANLLSLATDLLMEQFCVKADEAEPTPGDVAATGVQHDDTCEVKEDAGSPQGCSTLRADAPVFVPGDLQAMDAPVFVPGDLQATEQSEQQEPQNQMMQPMLPMQQTPQPMVLLIGPFPAPQGMTPMGMPAGMPAGMQLMPPAEGMQMQFMPPAEGMQRATLQPMSCMFADMQAPMMTPVMMQPGNMCGAVSPPVAGGTEMDTVEADASEHPTQPFGEEGVDCAALDTDDELIIGGEVQH